MPQVIWCKYLLNSTLGVVSIGVDFMSKSKAI